MKNLNDVNTIKLIKKLESHLKKIFPKHIIEIQRTELVSGKLDLKINILEK